MFSALAFCSTAGAAPLAQLGPLFFESSWMWLWAAAAAAPFIIHLLNRRQFREEPWAAMEFLLRAMRKNSRRMQIEQLILLLLRAAILLLIAAAWADWVWSSSGLTAGGPQGDSHTVLVIDASYSMAYQFDDATHFERAKQAAVQIVDGAARGDGFTLLLLADPPRVIIGEPAFDPQDVRQEIDAAVPPHAGADLPAALAAVEGVLAAAAKKHPRLTSRRVVLISDLQQATWAPPTGGDGAAEIERLSRQSQLVLLDVGRDDAENVAVTGLSRADPYLLAGREAAFTAQVRNFGRQDRSGLSVQFFVDDRVVADQRIDVAAGDAADLALVHRFESPGEHTVQVRLAEDSLVIDDRRWLSAPVRESMQVLCISGKPGAARYVALQLSPGKTSPPLIRTEAAVESVLLERDLARYDCVLLCNVGRFGEDEAAVLYDYLQGGGGVVWFLGDQVAWESYNQVLIDDPGERRVLPARLDGPADASQYRFDPRDYEHSIVSPFRGNEDAGLLTTPVWKYFRLQPLPQADSALWFDGGDPAIVDGRVGRGRSILVATAASTASVDASVAPPMPWTALSEWHSFGPLLYEMLAAASSGRFANREVTVGQTVVGGLTGASAGAPLEITLPGGEIEKVRLRVEGDRSVWSFDNTLTAGVYRANAGDPEAEEQLFAVNLDTKESDLSRVAVEDLPPALQSDAAAVGEDDAATAALGPRSYLYRWLLIGVLALLVIESLAAQRFGNRSI